MGSYVIGGSIIYAKQAGRLDSAISSDQEPRGFTAIEQRRAQIWSVWRRAAGLAWQPSRTNMGSSVYSTHPITSPGGPRRPGFISRPPPNSHSPHLPGPTTHSRRCAGPISFLGFFLTSQAAFLTAAFGSPSLLLFPSVQQFFFLFFKPFSLSPTPSYTLFDCCRAYPF